MANVLLVADPDEGDGGDARAQGRNGHLGRQRVVHGLGPLPMQLVNRRRPDDPLVVDRIVVLQGDRHRHAGAYRDDAWLEMRVVEADRDGGGWRHWGAGAPD